MYCVTTEASLSIISHLKGRGHISGFTVLQPLLVTIFFAVSFSS